MYPIVFIGKRVYRIHISYTFFMKGKEGRNEELKGKVQVVGAGSPHGSGNVLLRSFCA